MLTRMTEEDWATVLELFRACRSRRGAKGRNDRRVLEAGHDFCVHNITWRALPAECGNWNSIWKRFWRLSQAGVFEAFFDALAAMSQTAHVVQMFDSTVVRAHVSAAGAQGGQDGQALGRPRGGFSTKIHLKADLDGRPLAFHLTEGQAGDSPQFEILLDLGPDITPRAAVGDKGYDAKANRSAARERGICPVIPFKASAKNRPAFLPKALYRAGATSSGITSLIRRSPARMTSTAPSTRRLERSTPSETAIRWPTTELLLSPWQSGAVRRDQGIAKSGNPRARRTAIELAWLWLRHQPGSALARWFHERVGSSKGRMRRIMLVAMARKLIVSLWRYVTVGIVPEGAVLKV